MKILDFLKDMEAFLIESIIKKLDNLTKKLEDNKWIQNK
jgi:hypothetical protein